MNLLNRSRSFDHNHLSLRRFPLRLSDSSCPLGSNAAATAVLPSASSAERLLPLDPHVPEHPEADDGVEEQISAEESAKAEGQSAIRSQIQRKLPAEFVKRN